MIVLNLKTYQLSIERSLYFTDIAKDVAQKTGLRIVICPPATFLSLASERYSDVFAQHCDFESPGAFTGSTPAELLKFCGVKGAIINHSERRIQKDKISLTLDALHRNGLESLLCAATSEEMRDFSSYSPTYLAVEPSELISTGISVSKSRPEIVSNSVKLAKGINPKIIVLCGAGVSNKEDVKKALELGAEGVLLASAFIKAKDPKEFLEDLASAF